ncbi:MAG: protein kinase [Proteobacteria bacterium]|nr:protein kinase [Pseudomonadota bacterium]
MTTSEGLIGQVLGGLYRIDRLLASGSTALVYRGTHLRLGQPLAIKILAGPLLANSAQLARFAAEARVQAQLHHPHIVTIYDFIREGELHAIAMEYVEGPGLDQVMYELGGPMSVERIKALMLPVLDAVDYAHQHDIVHRDLKPSNILIAQMGNRELPKVVDFGIAKVVAEGDTMTAPGAMLGTLLFMSPEQCKALRTVDRRADVYSLGVTLYQLATGMVPFFAESAFDIMLAHVQLPPTPPQELEPSLPDELAALILRALEKDPDDRFAHVSEMARALAAVPVARTTAEHDSLAAAKAAGARTARPSSGSFERARHGPTGTLPAFTDLELEGDLGGPFDRAPPQPHTPTSAPQREPTRGSVVGATPTPSPSGEYGPAVSQALAPPSMGRGLGAAGHSLPRARRSSSARPVSSALLHELQSSPPERSSDPDPELPRRGGEVVRLRLRIPAREDWARYYDANLAGGGIFCPVGVPPQVGTPVRLEVTFIGGPRCFLDGVATWRRTGRNDARARAGVGIQLHPTQRAKVSYLNRWVSGTASDQRQLRRLPLRLRVTYSGRTGRRVNFTRDLNEEGVFIRSHELLPVGTPIDLVLAPPTKQPPVYLLGRVCRLIEEGPDRGMGISLSFPAAAERTRFGELVEEMERQFFAGELPEEVLG